MIDKARLRELAEPVVKALGFELWGIEYSHQGKQVLVRIYIDHNQGITVDDCTEVSNQLSGLFDVENPVSGEYILEVSSPGIDRPLFSLEQCRRYIGAAVQIRLHDLFEGRRNITGQLLGVENDEVIVATDDYEYILPFDLIAKANITGQV